MSKKNRRGHARSRLPDSPNEGVVVDDAAIPVVLLTDGRYMWSAEEHAYGFGFHVFEERQARGGKSWFNGPGAFGLTDDEWSNRIIIVSQPLILTSADELYWKAFVQQAAKLAGREPEYRHGDLIFR